MQKKASTFSGVAEWNQTIFLRVCTMLVFFFFLSQLLRRLLAILRFVFFFSSADFLLSNMNDIWAEKLMSHLFFCCISWGFKVANILLMPEIISKLRCWHQHASWQAGSTCHCREVTQEVKPSQNTRRRVTAETGYKFCTLLKKGMQK